MKKAIAGLIIIIVIVVIGGFIYIKNTPQYSLYQLKKAIVNHDGDTALKYVDIDSIVDNLIKELLDKEEPPPKNQWEAAGRNIGKTMMMAMLPKMKETLKSQLRTSIISADDQSNFSDLNKGSIWDFDIASQGKIAIVSAKEKQSAKFKMVQSPDGHWRIVEIIIPGKDIQQ